MFDRTTILREVHRLTRQRFTYAGLCCGYRRAFAYALRLCWHAHKLAAAEAAYQAMLSPIPTAVGEEAADMRHWAWWEPITTAGTARMVAQLAAANAMEAAARASAIHHH